MVGFVRRCRFFLLHEKDVRVVRIRIMVRVWFLNTTKTLCSIKVYLDLSRIFVSVEKEIVGVMFPRGLTVTIKISCVYFSFT